MNNLITVIVPVFNTGAPLAACVDSIVNQTYSPLEIILVDDGSTDEQTLAICTRYENEWPNIRVIHQPNGGPSKARNTGIENANGRFITFVDSDDYIEPWAYERLYGLAKKNNAMLVLGELTIDGTEQRYLNNGLEDGSYSQKSLLSKFMLGYWHSACTNLYHRELLKDLRFPLNEINEDYIFNFEVLMRSTSSAVMNTPFYHYVKQENSRTAAPASFKHLDWLKHVEYVKNCISQKFKGDLKDEADYQQLFANIVLANKCVLSIASGHIQEPAELYRTCTANLKKMRSSVRKNRYLQKRLRICGIAMSTCPSLYRSLILFSIKAKRWMH